MSTGSDTNEGDVMASDDEESADGVVIRLVYGNTFSSNSTWRETNTLDEDDS